MQIFRQSCKMILMMTFLTGIVYPIIITFFAALTMPWNAQGNLILKENTLVGSRLIGQDFHSEKYFWGRPSAVNYSTVPSGASNLGPTSAKLKQEIEQRRFKIAQAHNIQNLSLVPIELICASGSGIDPHISLETAYFQIGRVAKARNMTSNDMQYKILELINNNLDRPLGKLFGLPHVNVLILNLALDEFQKRGE